MAKKNIDLEVYIHWLNVAFNASVHTVTGYSPSFLSTLRQVRLPIDILFGRLGNLKDLSECAQDAIQAAGKSGLRWSESELGL